MKTVKSNPELTKVDFSNSKPVSEVPALTRLQAKRKAERANQELANSVIEPDVWQLIQKKATNQHDVAWLNNVLRAILA